MKNVNVRLDDELHARVKESADTEGRSLNSQIAWLLKLGLGDTPAIFEARLLERIQAAKDKGEQ